MGVTLKDVAALAGVSTSAVSRTFTEGASVSPHTREKVQNAAAELGYRPNVLASSLTTGRTKLIGLISDNFQNPVFLEVFDMFTRELQKMGLRPMLLNLSDPVAPDEAVRLLRQYSVDGVIVASSTLPVRFAEAFNESGIPVVHAFGRLSQSPSVNIVTIDNQLCGRLAAQTLIQRGYKHVAFMGGPASATSTQDRWAGFSAELSAHEGMTVSESYADAYTFDAGRREMLRLLQTTYQAEAYFCGDDVTAVGALSAIESMSLRCPKDIGVIGLNDIELAGWENINLTTIRCPFTDIIDTSIELMTRLLNEELSSPKTHLVECSLIERGSLRALPDA